MFVCGVSGKAMVIRTMNQYSLNNQGPAQKELTKMEKLDSISASPNVVATTTHSKILAYIQILEPIVDPVIGRSLVTYLLVDDLKLPSWISSNRSRFYLYIASVVFGHGNYCISCKGEF